MNLIEHKYSIKNYEIISVSSLPGWIKGFENEIAKNGLEVIKMDHIGNLNNIDAVVIPPLLDINFLHVIDKYIAKIIEKDIEVINLSGCVFKSQSTLSCSENSCQTENNESFIGIKSCVIYISGLGECCGVEQLELLIYDWIVRLGIKTKIVSSSWSAELFGFVKFPSFMYDKRIDEVRKAKRFNRFIHDLDTNDTDLIIIALTEPTLCYPNSLSTSENAYRQYLAAKGCPPDYSIFCIYAKKYLENEILAFKKSYIEAVGSQLSLIVMSTMSVDWVAFNDIEASENTYLKIRDEIVEKYSEKTTKFSGFSVVPISNIQLLVDDMLDKLSPKPLDYIEL